MKVCKKCGLEKELEEFGKNNYYEDNKSKTCKECEKYRSKIYRLNIKEIQKEIIVPLEYNEKDEAHYLRKRCYKIYRRALQSGDLINPRKCSLCDSTKNIQGHHSDYNEPLNVIWVCAKCHQGKCHNKIGKSWAL